MDRWTQASPRSPVDHRGVADSLHPAARRGIPGTLCRGRGLRRLLPRRRTLLVRKVLTAWRNYFLLTLPFTLLAILAHPRTAWIAAAWAPLATLALLYAVVAKYAHYAPEKPRRQPLAARFGSAGFLFPVLLPLSLILTVSYALRAERNLNRYLHDYD